MLDSQNHAQRGSTVPRTIRLLYVDDEPALVHLAEHKLGALGYEFTGLTSSRDALNLFQEDPQRFDVIVSDVAMPPPSGDQMVRLIHCLRPNLPIVLISGYENKISPSEAQRLNIVAFLFKPFRMEELDQRIRQMVPGH